MYQQFDVDIVPAACNFIKKVTPTQVFSCEFCKIIKSNCYAEHLRKTTSKNITIVRFFCKIYCSLKWKIKVFCKIYCSLKWKIKGYQSFLIMFMCLFTTFNQGRASLNTTII